MEKASCRKDINLLETPVKRLMKRYALPCIISLLVGALYNIVDQIFIANAHYLGSYGNAANTVVFPLTVVALAIAVMLGDGCCTFVSLRLGEGKKDEAGQSVGNAVVLTLVSGMVLSALYLLFAEKLLAAFGAHVNEKTFQYAKEYFFWIALGMPFYVFGQGMNPVIRADGSPRFAMVSTLIGAVINLLFDPLFIYTFHWGMFGAALATVLGQIVTAAMALYYLCHMKTVSLAKRSFLLSWKTVKNTLVLGICSLLSQLSLVCAMAAINNMVKKYGALDAVFSDVRYAQIPLAVLGIVMKFFQIVISVVVGMAAGCIPLVGFNLGARRFDRVRELFVRLLFYEGLIGAVALLIVEVFPRGVIDIFGAQGESVYYTAFALRAFRIYLCMMVLACVNKASFIFLQAMGKAARATMLSMVREIVFGVGFALLLPHFFGLSGVLYSMPLSDFLTFIVSFWMIVSTYRDLKKPIAI